MSAENEKVANLPNKKSTQRQIEILHQGCGRQYDRFTTGKINADDLRTWVAKQEARFSGYDVKTGSIGRMLSQIRMQAEDLIKTSLRRVRLHEHR